MKIRFLIKESLDNAFGPSFAEFKKKVPHLPPINDPNGFSDDDENGIEPEDIHRYFRRYLDKNKNFRFLGCGSFRCAWEVEDSRYPVVLKHASSLDGLNMNQLEITSYRKNLKVFPKVYDTAEDNSWILLEKVRRLGWNEIDKMFPELAELDDFKILKALERRTDIYEEIPPAIAHLKDEKSEFVRGLVLAHEFMKLKKKTPAPLPLVKFSRRPEVMEFLKSFQTNASWIGDLRDANLGINEEGKLVMIDTGLGIEEMEGW